MPDSPTGEIETVEAPTTDVPESESQPQEADQPQEETQESPESETGKNEVEDNPPKDNAAWAALRVENKRLKEAISTVDPEYLEKLRGANAQQDYNPQYQELNDDVEYSQVTKAVNSAQAEAIRANQRIAKLQAQLELQQDRQAEEAFPELKSDKVFQQIVAEKKLAARVLGHDRTTLEIAREVHNLLKRKEEQVVAQTTQTVKQQQVESRQAIADARGVTTNGRSSVADEEMRVRLRKGDTQALEDTARRIIGNLEF